jgi:putative flavoprotein involved in K+ transport
VHLSVGARQTPLPQRLFGPDIFSYLVATGLMDKTRDSRLGWRLRDRETLIGSSPAPPAARASSFTAGPPARRAAA